LYIRDDRQRCEVPVALGTLGAPENCRAGHRLHDRWDPWFTVAGPNSPDDVYRHDRAFGEVVHEVDGEVV
jgi:hypothetical protein